jgi:alkaline phosphatase D
MMVSCGIRKRLLRSGDMDRRRFLAHAAAISGIPFLGDRVEGRTVRGFRFDGDPFTLGVASGDPTSSGAVL